MNQIQAGADATRGTWGHVPPHQSEFFFFVLAILLSFIPLGFQRGIVPQHANKMSGSA